MRKSEIKKIKIFLVGRSSKNKKFVKRGGVRHLLGTPETRRSGRKTRNARNALTSIFSSEKFCTAKEIILRNKRREIIKGGATDNQ